MRAVRALTDSPTGSEDEEPPSFDSSVNPVSLPLSQLKRLKSKFVGPDGAMLKLTLDEFVEALGSNHRSSENPEQQERLRSQLCALFKKIDASCTETVNWEEFTEYMLQHMPGLNQGDASGGGDQQSGLQLLEGGGQQLTIAAGWGGCHADMISSVAVIQDIGNPNGPNSGGGGGGGGSGPGGRRYVTAGRDGLVKVWLPNLTVHKTLDVGQHRGRWLTACCWMTQSRRLAVACAGFRIFFYDSSLSGQPTTYIDYSKGTPLCLGYRASTESDGREKEILMVGDDVGCVTVYFLDDNWTSHESKQEGDALPFKKKPIRRQYHEGWVTKVGFVYELQSMVTCGLDGEINLCDVHTNQRKGEKSLIKLHKKYGVHCWCWCGSYKFFASGGLDRRIVIWNPYTPATAINYLQGHNAAIIDLKVNEAQNQLISLSADKVIKVWDIQHYRCISTFTDKTEYKPEDRLTCMVFDEDLPGLVMCSNTLNVLPMSAKVETNKTHSATIVGALYNDVFDQVISGDASGCICVWDVRTGELEFQFRRAHEDSKMTCLTLDISKRRLLTGAEDGEVRLWNYSSGQHLKTLRCPSEIQGIIWAQTALNSPEGPNTFVVVSSWDRRIYIWPSSTKSSSSSSVEPKYVLEDTHSRGHSDDVSCIVGITTAGGLLATGGDDGNVVLWKIQETSTSPVAAKMTDRIAPGPAQGGSSLSAREGSVRPTAGAAPPALGSLRRKQRQAGAPHNPKMLSSCNGTMEPLEVPGLTGATGSVALPGAVTAGGGVPGIAIPGNQGKSLRSSTQGEKDPGGLPSLTSATAPSAACLANAGTLPVTTGASAATSSSLPPLLTREKSVEAWPEELGLSNETSNSTSSAVEHMIFLEHKDCLLSTHADRRGRVWSHKKGALIQYMDLEAAARAHSRGSPDYLQSTPEKAAVTALFSDKENRWLFTGDQDGWVHMWDLTQFFPPSHPRLPHLQYMQPHRQAVTHLQHMVVEGKGYLASASLDCTVALSSVDGHRVGTFIGKNAAATWHLSDPSTWSETLPSLESSNTDRDGRPWQTPRRQNKMPGGPNMRGASQDPRAPGGPGPSGSRSARVGQLRTRPAAANPVQTGIFKKLSAVDRPSCKPDLTVALQEDQFLRKQLRPIT